jgi:hypothetical protein
VLQEFHSVTLTHLDRFGFNNKSSELTLLILPHDPKRNQNFYKQVTSFYCSYMTTTDSLIYILMLLPKLPLINVNSYCQMLCNLLLSHLYAHLLGSYVPNMWMQKYCANIQGKKNTYQLKLRRICTQLYSNKTTSYSTFWYALYQKRLIIVTLHHSWQLPVRNQVNVEILWFPSFWLRNMCSFIRILLHSWRTTQTLQLFLQHQPTVMHINV